MPTKLLECPKEIYDYLGAELSEEEENFYCEEIELILEEVKHNYPQATTVFVAGTQPSIDSNTQYCPYCS